MPRKPINAKDLMTDMMFHTVTAARKILKNSIRITNALLFRIITDSHKSQSIPFQS